ncbi:hypothetical protein [Plebeiibacterium marinum]|uniref:Uncharacterized protein n=1 Tax=Plebeiibacterium marinum TaxID=2992111 RepID=A0AAE3SLB3_9BACT|nr:hypothetical protein [Plebeiobacterium marinum]MCW3807517.1 hypothetical protein [Plebeiobacterium marinum]
MNFSFGSYVDFSIYKRDLDIKPGPGIAFGMGYKWKDRYALECRYYTPHDLLDSYASWKGQCEAFSITLGYTFF